MKKINCKLSVVVIFLLFSSCNDIGYKSQLSTSIVIDFNMMKNIDINMIPEAKMTPLETNDSSLLYNIEAISFLHDKMVIMTKDRIVVFNENGSFSHSIGSRGMGPAEYNYLSNFFIQKDSLFLFDSDSGKMLLYDKNGNNQSSINIRSNFTDNAPFPAKIYPLKNNLFVAKNRFRGDQEKTPAVSILSKDYKPIKYIEGRNLLSGLSHPDVFFEYGNEILYWEPFRDTIFSVVGYETIHPKYIVDFQDHAIPVEEIAKNNLASLVSYINSPEHSNRIATLVRYVHEDSEYVRFIFAYQGLNYVIFNKNTEEAAIYHIVDSKEKIKFHSFMLYQDGRIIFSGNDADDYESNPILFIISENQLINYYENQ